MIELACDQRTLCKLYIKVLRLVSLLSHDTPCLGLLRTDKSKSLGA
jgi:hypothetical protein